MFSVLFQNLIQKFMCVNITTNSIEYDILCQLAKFPDSCINDFTLCWLVKYENVNPANQLFLSMRLNKQVNFLFTNKDGVYLWLHNVIP